MRGPATRASHETSVYFLSHIFYLYGMRLVTDATIGRSPVDALLRDVNSTTVVVVVLSTYSMALHTRKYIVPGDYSRSKLRA